MDESARQHGAKARDGHPTAHVDRWARETRLAARALLRAPAYAVTAVATLALGICGIATVAMLSLTILRPLPYPDSDRLVAVWEVHSGARRSVAPANYLDWRRSASSFEGLAAHDVRGASITVDGAATRERVAVVSGNFFSVLGVDPALGAGFDPALDVAFPRRSAVLSHGGWLEAFGGDPSVLGRTLRVDDVTYEIDGVMPPGVTLPEDDLFAWLRSPTEAPEIRGLRGDLTLMRDAWYFGVVGRLAEQASLEVARDEMRVVATTLAEAHPDTNANAGTLVVSLLDDSISGSGPILLTLTLAVVLVLLAATVNVVHLGRARSAGRAGERAVRVALGASAADLRRLEVLEAALVGLGGGTLGAALSYWMIAAAGTLGATLPRSAEVAPSGLVAGLAVALSVALCATVAAAARGRTAMDTTAMRAIRGTAPGAATRRLVALQVASAVALLAGAGSMGRSVLALTEVDLGFEVERLTSFRLAIPDAPARAYEARLAEYDRVRDALASLPGVSGVSYGAESPLATGARAGVVVVGAEAEGEPPDAAWHPVDSGYFTVVGLPLIAGRILSEDDLPGGEQVAVVNEAFVRTVLRGRRAIGSRVTIGLDGHDRPLEIVGVVGDTRTRGPAEPAGPVLYRPVAQTDRYGASSVWMAARSGPGGPEPGTVLATARSIAPGLPLYAEASGDDLARPYRRSRSTLLVVLGAFALTTLLLGVVGVYGVTAHGVRQRRREIGVRMALGAGRARVTREIVGSGLAVALRGLPVGLVLAVALTRSLGGLLFGVSALDPWTLGGVAALVIGCVALALWIPGRIAAATDPARVTRDA